MVSSTEKKAALERLARTTQESFQIAFDHGVALQERNTRNFRAAIGNISREVRDQAESNRAVTRQLVERAEGQRDAYRTVIGESVEAWLGFVYAPLAYYREELREAVPVSDIVSGLPIQNYDGLPVNDVLKQLDGLTVDQLKKIQNYERSHKNRESLVDQLDRKIKAAS